MPLACPVRGCSQPLHPGNGAWQCPARHAFDIARAGYVNLLQPQDRRSTASGDAREAVEARQRLLHAGVGQALLGEAAAIAAATLPPDEQRPVALELGCGSGEFLGPLATSGVTGIGIDLSVAAITRAARSFPAVTWVVANADRRLPVLDASVDVVVSIHARRNPAECARVLTAGGALIVAVPAPDDLIELREAVLGAAVERARRDGVIAEHAADFVLESTHVHRERQTLAPPLLHDLLAGTYRAARRRSREHAALLAEMRVTTASDILVFRKLSPPGRRLSTRASAAHPGRRTGARPRT